jgi:hypothetical protein
MIKTYSEKLTPPYSGQVQIAESATYRALTMDGHNWEIQYVKRSHIRVGRLTHSEIKSRNANPEKLVDDVADPKLAEMLDFLADVELPFAATDCFEYWLLDNKDKAPLALIFSCSSEDGMKKFPSRADWTALPDSVMPIPKTDSEIANRLPPVNYRLESLVAERASTNSKAVWFDRREQDDIAFPPFLLREDWPEPEQEELCRRYIDRQSPRLLMLQELQTAGRERLEASCQPYAVEVARLCGLYPEILDEAAIRALRVEARLRDAAAG